MEPFFSVFFFLCVLGGLCVRNSGLSRCLTQSRKGSQRWKGGREFIIFYLQLAATGCHVYLVPSEMNLHPTAEKGRVCYIHGSSRSVLGGLAEKEKV
jgi:hypothetical protein